MRVPLSLCQLIQTTPNLGGLKKQVSSSPILCVRVSWAGPRLVSARPRPVAASGWRSAGREGPRWPPSWPGSCTGSRASCTWPLSSGGCAGHFHSAIVTELPRGRGQNPLRTLEAEAPEVSGPHFCHILLESQPAQTEAGRKPADHTAKRCWRGRSPWLCSHHSESHLRRQHFKITFACKTK